MDVLKYADARANLDEVVNRVVADHAPVALERDGAEGVVLVSLADWRSIEETNFLLSSPRNAARLLDAVAQVKAGLGLERELIAP